MSRYAKRGIYWNDSWDRVRADVSFMQVRGDTQTTHQGLFAFLNGFVCVSQGKWSLKR